mgnify:CR=1 FL=1
MKPILFLLSAFSIIILFALLLSIPLCLLWNWLMPMIFGLPTITIPQAFGLWLLSNMFFGIHNNIKDN